MMEFRPRLWFISFIVCLTSCASYKTKYASEEEGWKNRIDYHPEDVTHTIYFMGDGGAAYEGYNDQVFKALQEKFSLARENSSLVILGDNIFPAGLPREEQDNYKQAEKILALHAELLNSFPGRPFIIPGNHDWEGEGLSSVKRQEDYIKDKVGDNVFLPENGCPGPEVIDLCEQLTLIIIDSQWYLEDWSRSSEINEQCDIKNRADFIFELRDEIRKNKDKYVVIAMHHPMQSYSKHAGYYPAKSHLFPLTDIHPSLALPLPVVGSLVQLFKRNIGKEQDLTNPLYKSMISQIKKAVGDQQNIVFLSGHEHNQQLIQRKGRIHVVSGSGSQTSEVRLGSEALFVSGKKGFGKIEFYDNGEVVLYFYEVEEDATFKEIYRKQLSLEIADQADYFPEEFPMYYNAGDSIEASIYDSKISKGVLYNSLFGEHYRQLYTEPIKAPVFDLFSFEDGLRPVRRGGGSQTNSLRLALSDGREYVMRALAKDVSKLLPDAFRESIAVRFLEEQFTSAHPYAAFALPVMADAADIFHTHPRLYYIPKQPALEYFNGFHGNELYLFEERPDDDMSHAHNFGYSKKVISTPDLLEELYRDKEARVDQSAVIRARLFDLVINDWDRHDDQWRWALVKDGKEEIYAPIPRDRDQAFSKFDGWITGMLNKTIPVFRQMRSFDYDIPDVKAISHNARWFDRTFLNELDWEGWQREVAHLKKTLTIEVIQESIRVWPSNVYKKHGKEIEDKLISRVNDLEKYAWEYYQFLHKTIDISGTEDRDTFTIEMMSDKKVEVTVRFRGMVKYQRLIDPEITEEVRMYGREDEDVFELKSDLSSGMHFYFLGGEKKDNYIFPNQYNIEDQIDIFDNKAQPKQNKVKNIKLNRSDDPKYYTYNRKSYQYDYGFFTPSIGFDPDDGILLGLGYSYTNHGFLKWPSASRHTVSGRIGVFSQSYRFRYKGEYFSALGEQDFIIRAEMYNPQFIINFFGFGNETERQQEDINFYRTRNRLVSLDLGLRKRFPHGGSLVYGLGGEMRKVIREENKFLALTDAFDQFYRNQIFFTGYLDYEMSNVDKSHNPTRGLKFNLGFHPRVGMRNTNTVSLQIQSSLTLYQEVLDAGRLVLAGRIGIDHFLGDVDLFQYAALGGRNEIRGYRNERFAGNKSIYFNTDVRTRLGEVNMIGIPFSIGLNGGIDFGRVYLDGEDSDTWHNSITGGLWLSPFNVATISTAFSKGSDENRITVGLGFFF